MTSLRLTLMTVALAALVALPLLIGCGYSARPVDEPGQANLAAGERSADSPRHYQLGRGYIIGSLHPADVKTVHVQMFQSQDFRRGLEFRLTEAVAKRILNDTPYRIADQDVADTVLYGEIVRVNVTLLGTDAPTDLPREVQPELVTNWTWKDLRSGRILAQQRGMRMSSEFLPPANETFFDGTEELIDDLAERIVEMMESPW